MWTPQTNHVDGREEGERNNNGVIYTPCNTRDDLSPGHTAKTGNTLNYSPTPHSNNQQNTHCNRPENGAVVDLENSGLVPNSSIDGRNSSHDEQDSSLRDVTAYTDSNPESNERHVTFRILKSKDKESEKKKKKKEKKMKEKVVSHPWGFLLRDFTQYTTLHGIRFITLETRFIFRRIFWVLLVLFTIGIFVFYVCDRVNEFLKFKKNISVEENYVAQMPFPSVTFCNQNRIRLTAAAEKGWYDAVVKLYKVIEEKELRQCLDHEFTCAASRLCISRSKQCDAYPDCADASDELQCDICPRVLIDGPEFTNVSLQLQRNTFSHIPDPVYVANDNDGKAYYLYYSVGDGGWLLSNATRSGYVYVALGGNEGSIPAGVITSEYNGQTYAVGCHALDMESLKVSSNRSGEEQQAQRVSMAQLYKEGKHETDVFIENCLWKGKKCDSRRNFRETITDLGVCYTFTAEDMFVEASGPGNGLTLHLNIEQYEYTKDPGKGVGIKVLIHEQGHMAVMEEAGIAISPGLYSLLAMEKTEITNLEKPWGNCSEWDLEYFDKYSMSTCKMNCDNVFSRKQCNCRNADMPQLGEDDKDVCTLGDFTNCLMPQLAKAKIGADYCRCNIPCKEAVYVPSLSFAAVSVDEDTIKSRRQESKMADLEAKLTKAREITYRLANDKYRETMRVMSLVKFRGYNLIAFLNATEAMFHQEKIEVVYDFDAINSDCAYLLNTSRWLESMVGSSLHPSLQNFLNILQILEFQIGDFAYVQRLPAYVDQSEEREFIQDLSTLYQSVNIDPLTVEFSYSNEFINETVNSTVEVTLPEFEVESNVSNYEFDSYAYYIMLRSRLYTVLNSVNMAIEKLETDMIKTFHNFPSEVEVDLGGVKTRVSFNETKQELLRYAEVVRNQLTLIKENTVRSFANRITTLRRTKQAGGAVFETKLEQIIQLTNTTIHETVAKAVQKYKELGNILSPKCEYESKNLKAGFYEAQDQVINRMTEMRQDVSDLMAEINSTTHAYIHGDMSLNTVAGYFDLQSIRNSFNAYSLAVENLIAQKIVTIKRLVSHGKGLEELSASKIPTSQDDAVDTTDNFGTDVIAESQKVIRRMRQHVVNFTRTLLEEENYLRTYADGNILNEEFFKKNYLQLELFYKTLTDKKVTQQKAYEYPALLSEVGGLMGLLLGASLITIFELLDLLVYNGLLKCCDSRSRRKDSYNTSKVQLPEVNHVLPLDVYAQRRKKLVPLASMDTMEGLDIENGTPIV